MCRECTQIFFRDTDWGNQYSGTSNIYHLLLGKQSKSLPAILKYIVHVFVTLKTLNVLYNFHAIYIMN